jgi:hypothetical protein
LALHASVLAKNLDRRPVFRVQIRRILDWFFGIPGRMGQNLSRLDQIHLVLYHQILA